MTLQSYLARLADTPHHPHLSTFPHHRHAGSSVIEAGAPDLTDILREIDALVYTLPNTKTPAPG